MRKIIPPFLGVVCLIFLCTSCVTKKEAGISVPHGYELLHLPGFDGAILKPKGWYFCEFGTSKICIFRISKEPCDSTNGILTGFTITYIAGVSKITGMNPSEYANKVLKDYRKLDVVSTGCGGCEYNSGQGPVQQQEWIVDEQVHAFGSNTICRVGITTMAADRVDLLVVIVFGTPKDEWETNKTIYDTVRKNILILGPHPG